MSAPQGCGDSESSEAVYFNSQLTRFPTVTAAETMTIGPGSCDDATSYAGPGKDQKEKEDNKKMDGEKQYYDGGAATSADYAATSTNADSTSTYPYTTSTYQATSSYYASSSTYSDAGAYAPAAYPVYQGEGDKGKDVKDEEMSDKEMSDKGMNDKGMNDKGMNDKGMNDKGMNDKEMNDKGMNDKEMNDKEMKDKEMKDKEMKDKEEQDKGMPKDSEPKKPENGQSMYVVRRQTGGTVSMVMAPFIGMNDTIIMPASVGAPQPQPGVELLDDPAKNVGTDGWSSACGI